MALNQQQMFELAAKLKKLVDAGALGPRAASLDNALIPGDVVDLLWMIIFGKTKEECETKGGIFVLGMWKEQPLMSWHLNNIDVREIISLLAATVGMIGERLGRSVIDDMITALTALRERQDIAEATDGKTEQ